MLGILRITKAEFIKIFKKPSVYIMGLLLASVIVFALFSFSSPARPYFYTTNITGSTINDMNNVWLGNTDVDSKNKIDINFDDAQSIIDFYSKLNERTELIKVYQQEFLQKQNLLNNVILGGTPSEINSVYPEVKNALQSLVNAFITFNGLDEYGFVSSYIGSSAYTTLYNEDIANLGTLNELLNKTSESASNFNAFYLNNEEYSKAIQDTTKSMIFETMNTLVDDIDTTFDTYKYLVLSSPLNNYNANMELYRIALQNSLGTLKNYVEEIVELENKVILIESQKLESLISFIEKAYSKLSLEGMSAGQSLYAKHRNIVLDFDALKVAENLNSKIKSDIKEIIVSNDTLDKLNALLGNRINDLKQDILLEIQHFASENSSITTLSAKDEFKRLTSNYKALSHNTLTYVENEITLDIVSEINPVDVTKFVGFNNVNTYELKESSVKINYLFTTATNNLDYLNVFTFNQNSSTTTTIYDFMYYALKISSVIIVVFAIVMASNIMAYEFDTGTIKLLAIRPFKRHKILLGKLFAVMFFVIVFVIFSAIISAIAGLGFTITFKPVLAVFNATFAFEINPILLILIDIVSIIIEVLFYAIIALAISTIFRSFAGAMSTSLVVLLVGLLFNSLFSGFIWYSYLPFINVDFFRFLGGAFSGLDNSLLSTILQSSLLPNANIIISAIIYLSTIFVALISAYIVLKKRDI